MCYVTKKNNTFKIVTEYIINGIQRKNKGEEKLIENKTTDRQLNILP